MASTDAPGGIDAADRLHVQRQPAPRLRGRGQRLDPESHGAPAGRSIR